MVAAANPAPSTRPGGQPSRSVIRPLIKASEGSSPWNGFDSVLDIPNGDNPRQNAWLTLQLRIKLNFCDSRNQTGGRMVQNAGRWYAKDADDYMFPALDWTSELMDKFMRGFVKKAEATWNYQFLLVTPRDYDGLDYDADWRSSLPLRVRPNVLCLLRVAVMGPGGLLDNSPSAGPLRTGSPHRTINVFNLDKTTRAVNLAPGVTATADTPNRKSFSTFNDGSFRSDSDDYDDSDLFHPRVVDAANNVNHNTIGHEIGHALGQAHVRGLNGDDTCAINAVTGNDSRCYGVDMDGWDIMGGGDRLYLVNAVSWRQRISQHTGAAAATWATSGIMQTPPRSLPLGIVNANLGPPMW
jgi:hypothetical protein